MLSQVNEDRVAAIAAEWTANIGRGHARGLGGVQVQATIVREVLEAEVSLMERTITEFLAELKKHGVEGKLIGNVEIAPSVEECCKQTRGVWLPIVPEKKEG
jgi:hypothetical protein